MSRDHFPTAPNASQDFAGKPEKPTKLQEQADPDPLDHHEPTLEYTIGGGIEQSVHRSTSIAGRTEHARQQQQDEGPGELAHYRKQMNDEFDNAVMQQEREHNARELLEEKEAEVLAEVDRQNSKIEDQNHLALELGERRRQQPIDHDQAVKKATGKEFYSLPSNDGLDLSPESSFSERNRQIESGDDKGTDQGYYPSQQQDHDPSPADVQRMIRQGMAKEFRGAAPERSGPERGGIER